MSDTESSGAVTAAAETASTPSAPPDPAPPSTFSNSRGSGLARGKRPASPSAQTVSAAPAADYKLTAVSVITAPTEYKNPFAPPAPVAAPAPAEANTPAPASTPSAVTSAAGPPGASAPPAAEIRPADDQPNQNHGSESGRGAAAEADAKPAELKILPPEAPKRVEHNWESDSFRSVTSQPGDGQIRPTDVPPAGPRRDDRRGERPYFRPERERRFDRTGEGRPAWGDSNRNSGDQAGRTETPSTPPPAAEPRKTGGLFAWFKRLFGGASAETTKPETDSGGDRGYGHDGHYHRRRRRGHGRQFQGDQRGPRDGQPSGENRGYGGEQRYRGRRRRHNHGGGDYRGGSRPEGGPPAGS